MAGEPDPTLLKMPGPTQPRVRLYGRTEICCLPTKPGWYQVSTASEFQIFAFPPAKCQTEGFSMDSNWEKSCIPASVVFCTLHFTQEKSTQQWRPPRHQLWVIAMSTKKNLAWPNHKTCRLIFSFNPSSWTLN